MRLEAGGRPGALILPISGKPEIGGRPHPSRRRSAGRVACAAPPQDEGGTSLARTPDRPHALMSHVKPRRRNSPASPQTPERYRCDDRATVGAKPRDVGQHPLMSHVKPRRRNSPASPQTPERYRCDDRATVGAKPRDVGQHPLIRGFTHVRASVWGCPGLRTGVDLAIGLTARSGIPLAAAPLPPLHEIIFTGPCPGAGSLKIWFARAAGSLRTSRLTLLQQAQG